MIIKVESIIKELSLTPFGAKGWLSNTNIPCPNCHKVGKFGFNISDKSGAVHCFKCDFSQNIVNYLRDIDKGYLVSFQVEYSMSKKLEDIGSKNNLILVNLPEVDLPKGYQEVNYLKYLEDRGFRSYQYVKYGVGITEHFLEKRLHGYILFKIRQNGKLVAWLARSKKSKEWHKENLIQYKEGRSHLYLRYRNSTGTDFASIIGNYDDITDNTHTLILVEGLFDCVNIENLLNLNNQEEVKCCFTFGNKISEVQIELLKNKKSVKRIILMYDPGTIDQMKQYGLLLSRHFEVFVAEITQKDIDPGDIDEINLTKVLKNMKNIYYFYNNRINLNI